MAVLHPWRHDADIITLQITLRDRTFGGMKYPDLFPSVGLTNSSGMVHPYIQPHGLLDGATERHKPITLCDK